MASAELASPALSGRPGACSDPAAAIEVEVVYSPAAEQVDLVSLLLPLGSTLRQAVQASGMLTRHPGLVEGQAPVGVWGRLAPWDQVLAEGDRVELYRPLQVDPKESRRLRYRAQGERGRSKRPGQRA